MTDGAPLRFAAERRTFLQGALIFTAGLGAAQIAAVWPAKAASDPPGFADFLQSLWPLAEAQGVGRDAFRAATDGLSFDASVPSSAAAQPEFDKPLSAYLIQAVSAPRVARGRQEAARWSRELAEIESRFGVPAEICLAAWGMETDFGRDLGTRDVLRTLASLAFRRTDRTIFAEEFVAAVAIYQRGVTREKLKGSWAGAMGNPQFLPSAYLKYAVAYTGANPPDIWTSVPDSLASIAHFFQASGWQPGLPWGTEVILPAPYDFASLHMSFADWAKQGVRAANGRSLPSAGEATLFLPSGAGGPTFLLSANYWILKAYNNSDSYALSLALLAERIAGSNGLHGTWPAHEKIMSRTEKAEMQRLLREYGLYEGSIDGRFGPTSREAIHQFQIKAGIHPADGYGTEPVLQALRTWRP